MAELFFCFLLARLPLHQGTRYYNHRALLKAAFSQFLSGQQNCTIFPIYLVLFFFRVLLLRYQFFFSFPRSSLCFPIFQSVHLHQSLFWGLGVCECVCVCVCLRSSVCSLPHRPAFLAATSNKKANCHCYCKSKGAERYFPSTHPPYYYYYCFFFCARYSQRHALDTIIVCLCVSVCIYI